MKSYRQEDSHALLMLHIKTASQAFIDSAVLIKVEGNCITFYFVGNKSIVITDSLKFLDFPFQKRTPSD